MKDRYLKKAQDLMFLEAKEEKKLLVLSILRLVVFAGGVFLIWFGFSRSLLAGLLLMPVIVILFLYLLKRYSYHTGNKIFLSSLILVNQNEADAFSGNLSAFEPGNGYADPHHSFSNDVDLFGNNSLFHYLNRTVTGYGRDILAGWLSDPFALSEELILRQEAVKELAIKEEWRHTFMASGMKKTLEKINIDSLVRWMNAAPVIKSTLLKRILIYFLPSAAVFSLLLVLFGIVPFTVFAFIFLLNLLVVAAGLKNTNYVHRQVTGVHNYLSSIYQLLKAFDKEIFNSSLLNDIRQNISGRKSSAAVSVKGLSRLIQAFDTRLNIIVSFILNGLFLWDYHCIFHLEKWKSEYRDIFPVWIEMLGKTDAFISLGNYAFNNPGFVYPVNSGKKGLFSIISAGHPLINESKRVCNDFAIARSGNVCIISGANMSGKSTFLRTIAVNYILGMSGAPVCAGEMFFTPLKIFTSMRTTDSLSDNESYFYAELRRLKMLKSEIERGEPVLFILDEILKGTNSADKSLGSKLFMKRIVELGGTGLIATHDTSLGEMEAEYPGVVINKCFEIEIEGETIRFDYKLQNGITRKMNAAILMRQMGILE
jgi:hypothetical protein